MPLRILKTGARSLRNAYRRNSWRAKTAAARVEVDHDAVTSSLSALGVTEGDLVFVHSGLSALGFVVGGPHTIVDAVLTQVGSRGTVLMPAYPFRGRMLEHLRSGPVFDADEDRSHAGAIPEHFRTVAEFRSLHPTHSISGSGPEAEWCTKDHHLDDSPFGANSPFHRAYEKDAKILCIGSDIAHVSMYHIVEEITDFPKSVYDDRVFEARVRRGDEEHVVHSKAHDPEAATRRIEADPATEQQLDEIFTAMGVLRRTPLGKGEVRLLHAKPMIDFLVWGANRGFTIYGDLNRWNPRT